MPATILDPENTTVNKTPSLTELTLYKGDRHRQLNLWCWVLSVWRKIKEREEKIRGCYFRQVGEEDSLDDI